MNKKIKILLILNSLSINGISSVVINYCKKIDLNLFEFTIAAGKPIDKQYVKLCKELNISIIELPSKRNHIFRYYKKVFEILNPNKYDIVHIHGNSTIMAIELFIAWLKGIKIRIAHCHNSSCEYIKLNKILKPLFNFFYTHGFACSMLAGKWLFGEKKFCVIPNAFETQKFVFNNESRINVRKKLNIENKFVIGHVGRINSVKNQEFLISIFELIAKENKDAVLLLIGTGPGYNRIKDMIDNSDFSKRIILYGETDHVEELYNAMDIFVFPSKYEGLGIVMVEAQINGLPCVASYAVPEDAVISNNVTFIDINNEDRKKWKNVILASQDVTWNREHSYKINESQISKYDINMAVKYMEQLYMSFINYM